MMALFVLFTANTTSAQTVKTPAASPLQSLTQAFALSEIGIEYSRPSAKGRVIFGELVPYGKVWRTGANASTKITFGEDVKIEGKALKAGTYAVYTTPNKENWDIMFYSDLTLGGNVAKYDASKEVLKVNVKSSALTEKVETFTINVGNITASKASVDLTWENTKASFEVVADIDAAIMADIDKALNNDNKPYYQAANYYYENGKDLNIALGWAKKAAEQRPDAFWVKMLQAKIEFKLKDYKACQETANKVIEMAKKANNADYVKMAEDLIADAKKAK